MTTPEFEFVIEESAPVAGGIKVTGRVRRGRVTAGAAGWLQERGSLAIAVDRIDVEAAPASSPRRMVLVLRGLPVAMVTAGAVLRSHAHISDRGVGEQHLGPPAANAQT